MRKMLYSSVAVSAFIFAATSALASPHGSKGHWGYSGEVGPEHWASLEPAYEMCGKGVNQSPIDLTGFIEAELEPIRFDYRGLATEIVNNGHAIQANYAAGSTITVAGRTFELKQFHFHAPSENTIDGKYFAMESHFVHADENGKLAVIAVMYVPGEANEGMAKLWKQMPKHPGDKEAMASQVKAEDLLPTNREYYRFNGSLTTPPCTEGVLWLVMKNPVTVYKEQVKQFSDTMGFPNNRPVQPVGARPVLK
ncbi:carbonic anhydrase [Desulfolithobacter sp.]